MEDCFTSVHRELTHFQLAQKGQPDGVSDGKLEELGSKVSLQMLFEYLQLCDTMEAAIVVEESIKEIWKAHLDPDMRWRLDVGISELLRGNKEGALVEFKKLLEEDPDYAEAWNKAATCYFMMGHLTESLEAATRTLELQPKHFQALSGLGLAQYETRRYRLAAESFRKSLRIDPWSPVSSRLSSCLDLLVKLDLEEDEGSKEGSAPYETR